MFSFSCGAILLISTLVASQSAPPDATCLPEFSWAQNAAGKSPCSVGGELQMLCAQRGNVRIPSLPPRTQYLGPVSPEAANPCVCNTITYSLISACGVCQNRSYINWAMWATNCSVVSVGFFPVQSIPANIQIPLWAYLNISETLNRFDPIRAQRNASAVAASVGSSTAPSPTGIENLPSPTQTSVVSVDSGTRQRTNAGAIAGGVVGGIAILVGSILLLWYLYRRRRQQPVEETWRAQDQKSVLDHNFTGMIIRPHHAHHNSGSSAGPYDIPMSSPISETYTTRRRDSLDTLPTAFSEQQHNQLSYGGREI